MPQVRIHISEHKMPEDLLEALFNSLDEDDNAPDCRECLKAKERFRVLECATPTQFVQIWDRTLKGEKFTALVDELGKVQNELAAAFKAKEDNT